MKPRRPLQLRPQRLVGRHVTLEPMRADHLDTLCVAGADPAIWTWYPQPAATPGQMRAFVETALAAQDAGEALCYVQTATSNGEVMGSTRLQLTSAKDYRAEIGWTWLAPRFQRTAVNTESKYLLLCHAFEVLDLLRVEFKTDALNSASRAALARIGAREEGILRSHMLMATGRVRDSVYFSITESDWPQVKRALEQKQTLRTADTP